MVHASSSLIRGEVGEWVVVGRNRISTSRHFGNARAIVYGGSTAIAKRSGVRASCNGEDAAVVEHRSGTVVIGRFGNVATGVYAMA